MKSGTSRYAVVARLWSFLNVWEWCCENRNGKESVIIWATSWQNYLCAQQRLRLAWASAQSDQSSLCAQWVAKDPSFLHADSKDSDQTGQMSDRIVVEVVDWKMPKLQELSFDFCKVTLISLKHCSPKLDCFYTFFNQTNLNSNALANVTWCLIGQRQEFASVYSAIYRRSTNVIIDVAFDWLTYLLAHLSRRLTRWAYRMGLEPACVRVSVRPHFQTWISPRPAGRLQPNFIWSIIGVGERLH